MSPVTHLNSNALRCPGYARHWPGSMKRPPRYKRSGWARPRANELAAPRLRADHADRFLPPDRRQVNRGRPHLCLSP
jgi:hypothetical protein